MNYCTRISLIALLLCVGWGRTAIGQEGTANSWVGTNGDWAVGSNWSAGELPDGVGFDEYASISNGGTANVTSPIPFQPGQVILAIEDGSTGSVVIGNGGTLTTVDRPATSGEFNVGYAATGTGNLTVQPGGTLNIATNLYLTGAPASSITLGGAGAGVTAVNIGFAANFGRNLRVIGPNVNLSALSVNFQAESTFTAQITGATHSALKSTNVANLGGKLKLEFSGVTPTLGSSWNLIDASSFAGQFSSIDASAAPALPFGQVYEFNTVAGGGSTNGMYGRVSVAQKLVLNVNRSTGAVSMATGPGTVSIDGYAIKSAQGSLSPAGWNSLQAQGVSDWRRSPQVGTSKQLIELKPTGSTAITSATPRALGNAFAYPAATQFGVEWEDLTFEYYTPDGKVTQGLINYTGTKRHNNLVLVVDPATGNAQVLNQSNLSVNIDGYKITSTSGSLLPANGKWLSLDDDNRLGGDWRESNASVNQLAELKPTGSSQMAGGATFLSMGQMFKTVGAGGTQDLVFEYLFPGESAFRQGVVVYGTLTTPSLAADFNHDNTVNGLDLTVWKGAFGTGAGGDADGDNDSDGADFLIWQRQFGQSVTPSTTTAAAVPEPATLALLGLGAIGLAVCSRRSGGESH
ncbi:PEP-CTERM sorting domain-containing protein [Lacipirellula parvula]|uniref:Ice-binding protein C-terminal domain-containing protein n=1 Tax=Lacipirellula parvula TaxID=2650471 RepID=A0A5K7XG13_9BACT|nr:PEP-CTERM sorting domain-containing protein [Lacipirellula parvula]BBO33821.1 hypothetical protein PLANPX_3433 [Lacipirellula parvula]